jgi:chromosome partitioning protein
MGGKVAPVIVSHRAAFGHSVIAGKTAQEFEPDGRAAEEIASLWAWASRELKLPVKPLKPVAV